MKAHKNLLLTNTINEIVQTIKQNNVRIRNIPGTVLKNTINGKVVYTPPCCEEVLLEKRKGLEQFINDNSLSGLDPLIKMALIHYQCKAIHPFSNGNSRTGCILNALYLVQQGLLTQPVLYLSSYIVRYQPEYYQLLRDVTEKGAWQDWIMNILTAVVETAELTTAKIRKMLQLREQRETQAKTALGASYSHAFLHLMFTLPYLKIELLEKTGLSHRQTASTWLKKLVATGILHPQKIGQTTYFINYRLMELLSNDLS